MDTSGTPNFWCLLEILSLSKSYRLMVSSDVEKHVQIHNFSS